MNTGTVRWFSSKGLFGSIKPDNGGNNLFVHQSDIQTSGAILDEGQKVQYEAEKGCKGIRAKNVGLAGCVQ